MDRHLEMPPQAISDHAAAHPCHEHYYRLLRGVTIVCALVAAVFVTVSWHKEVPIKSSGRLNLTVKSEWVGDTTPARDVQVNLYARGSRYFYNETTGQDFYEEGIFLVDTVELNASNHWTYSWVDQPRRVHQLLRYGTYLYTYDEFFIREAYPYAMDYDISYGDGSGQSLTTTALKVDHRVKFPKWWDPYESGTVTAAPADKGTVIIYNEQSYQLTHAAANCIRWLLIGGGVFLLANGVFFTIKKCRKNKTGGKLDEEDL